MRKNAGLSISGNYFRNDAKIEKCMELVQHFSLINLAM